MHSGGISWKHFIALVLGAVGIAFAPIFTRLAKETGGVGMLDAAFWRVFIGAVAVGFVVIPRGQALGPERPRIGTWIWLPGVLFAVDFAVWHMSFDHTSVANSTLLANVSLVFVTVFAWWFWKEKIGAPFLIGAGIAGAGVALLLLSSKNGHTVVPGGNPLFGDFLGLVTAVFYGGYLITTKAYRRDNGAPKLMFWSGLVAAICLLPIVLIHKDPFFPDTPAGWWPLLGVGVVSHAIGQGLIAYGLAGLPASLASITLLVQPLCVALLGWLILGQRLDWLQAAGGIAVIAGLAVAILGRVGK